MVLYHLLAGVWPYIDLDRSEMMTATLRGDRPDFDLCGYTLTTSLPSLKSLMEDCWEQKPQDRPGGPGIIEALSDASLLCFRQIVPLKEAAVVGMFCESENNVSGFRNCSNFDSFCHIHLFYLLLIRINLKFRHGVD